MVLLILSFLSVGDTDTLCHYFITFTGKDISKFEELNMKELIKNIQDADLTVDENAELQLNDELVALIAGGKGDTETSDMGDINIICHIL